MLEDIKMGSTYDASSKVEKCVKIYKEISDLEKDCKFTSEQERKADENNNRIMKLEAQIVEKFGNNFGY